MPPPSDETQKVTGPTATPQALCSVVSVIGATPGWSETRSVAIYDVASTNRFSNVSTVRRRVRLRPGRFGRRLKRFWPVAFLRKLTMTAPSLDTDDCQRAFG